MSKEQISIKFLGGAGTVTGSKTMVEYGGKRVLVDCGLFQGLKELRDLNWNPFPVPPASFDALILTHAHLDHCGYIPVFVKHGFKGNIHCTHPTKDLTEIILKDSAKIQEEEADRANRHKYTRHDPAKPLYTVSDAMSSLKYMVPHNFREWVIINEHMKFRFLNSGHIIGSAMVELKVAGRTIFFSGDIGRQDPILLPPRELATEPDVIIMESTYGDRLHEATDPIEQLSEVIDHAYEKRGILIIPTFAVERAQELLVLLSQLKAAGRLPHIPVYLDSPMGVSATKVMQAYPEWHTLNKEACYALDAVASLIVDAKVSRAIVANKDPKIVMAGSGMVTGGRVLHYLNNHIQDERNTILIVGYQAAGTRGRALVEGEREIKFFGEYHPVKAEVLKVNTLSAHADQAELIRWLGKTKGGAPSRIFLNHGEPHQANALRTRIEHELGWNCTVAQINREYLIPVG